MARLARHVVYSYDEYLHALEMSDVKLEYFAGVIYAMAGGTPAHAFLGAAAVNLLRNQLRGVCNVASSDLKIRIDAADVATFSDGSVICGPVAPSAIDSHAATNPGIVVEVTSKSTEAYDRGEKLALYQQLPSVRAVLIVSHRAPLLTLVQRTETGWTQRDFGPGESATIATPAVTVSVDELYAGITLDPV